jgi:hypothetical protein
MRLYLIALITVIILAHIAMWSSDMPRDLALKLTLINASGWGVILGGAWLVGRWAAAHTRRDKET